MARRRRWEGGKGITQGVPMICLVAPENCNSVTRPEMLVLRISLSNFALNKISSLRMRWKMAIPSLDVTCVSMGKRTNELLVFASTPTTNFCRCCNLVGPFASPLFVPCQTRSETVLGRTSRRDKSYTTNCMRAAQCDIFQCLPVEVTATRKGHTFVQSI